MMLYISAMDHAGKLKLGSYKQNASILLRFSDSVQCTVRENTCSGNVTHSSNMLLISVIRLLKTQSSICYV